MLISFSRTAGKSFLMSFLAVFFSLEALASERPLNSIESGMNDLIFQLSRSVVTVECSRAPSAAAQGAGRDESGQRYVSSGIVCDTLGHILVAGMTVTGRDRIIVSVDNQPIPAQLIGIDQYSDLAIIKATRPIGYPVQYSERQVCAGQMVVAMGNAYGMRASPTIGFCAGARTDGTMQFTVPVTSGSVGGGVFDLNGRLIGVIVGVIGQRDQVALAVPAYRLPEVVEYLVAHGDREAGYIGVSTADIEMTPGIEMNMPAAQPVSGRFSEQTIDRGVVVTYVEPSSPAAVYGLSKGDLIIGFNHVPVHSALELSQQVRRTSPGTVVDFEFVRHTSYFDIRLQVGNKRLANPSGFFDVEQFDSGSPSPDSLQRVLDYLKREVQSLEERLHQVR